MKIKSSRSVRGPNDPPELAGAIAGRNWLERMAPMFEREAPGLHALDFADVSLATVSWLREGPIGLLTRLAQLESGVVLVIANATPLVREEIVVALGARRCVMLAARVTTDLQASEPELLGGLDDALDETLKAILDLPEFDAKALTERVSMLGLSAANNRLANLEAHGVLASERRGRSRVYRLTMDGMRYGH